MMNRKEFFDYVKDNVKDFLPDSVADANIRLQEVAKNNGLTLTAMQIPVEGKNVMPNVYLDPFYQEYLNGKSPDACVGDVADVWIEDADTDLNVNINTVMDYENVKDMLQVRICDPELNGEYLKGKVVTEHGDFAAYYAINLTENGENIASIPVTDRMMDAWGIDVETLHADALKADKSRGPVLYSMDEMMASMFFGVIQSAPTNLFHDGSRAQHFVQPMFVLTNEDKMNGASLILHEDIRKQLGEFMQGDYFVLPSSIHETLLLPDSGMFEVHDLNQMVQDVNETQVELQERLSDKVQFCDGKTAVMENAEKREARKQLEKEAAVRETSEKTGEKSGIHGKLDKAKAEIKEKGAAKAAPAQAKKYAMEL